MRDGPSLDIGAFRCGECHREVDEFTAIAEKWGYWSDGVGELVAFCPECARREFAPDAPATGLVLSRGVARAIDRLIRDVVVEEAS